MTKPIKMIISRSAVDIISAMSGKARPVRQVREKALRFLNPLMYVFILMLMACMNHASANAQFADLSLAGSLIGSNAQAAEVLQQQTPTQTPSLTPESVISTTPTVTATLTSTLPSGSGTLTLTALASTSPEPTITDTVASTQAADWTPTPSATASITPEEAPTATPSDFTTTPPETELPPELTPSSTATLIPYPTLGFRLATPTNTPYLLVLEHPAGATELPKQRGAKSIWLAPRGLARLWPVLLIFGIWVVLIAWFVIVHYLDRR